MRENFGGVRDFHITHEIQRKTGITNHSQKKLKAFQMK